VAAGDRVQRGGVTPRDQGVQREPIGVALDEVAHLAADGAGRAQQRQSPG
jgi:hypothetical protein